MVKKGSSGAISALKVGCFFCFFGLYTFGISLSSTKQQHCEKPGLGGEFLVIAHDTVNRAGIPPSSPLITRRILQPPNYKLR